MYKLNIKTVHKSADRDSVLLHTAFTVLCDFIEKEKPEELNKEDLIDQHAIDQNDNLIRLRCLYYWWKYVRSTMDMGYLEKYQFDTDRLQELVSLRENMWT